MKGARVARAALLALGVLVPMSALAHHLTGHTLWRGDLSSNSCVQCHADPDGAGSPNQKPPLRQRNGAGNTSTVLDFVFPSMGCGYANARSNADRVAIAQYMLTLLPQAIDTTTTININKLIDVTGYLQTGGLAFTHVATASNPVREGTGTAAGTLTFSSGTRWTGYTVTYNPPTDFVGYVTFGFRGVYWNGSSTTNSGHIHTARIRVGSVPNIIGVSPGGTVGTALNYTFDASNAPTSFGYSGAVPTGTSRVGQNVSGTPTAAGSFPVSVTATNALGNDMATVTFTIAKGTPTLTFPVAIPADQVYSPSGTFASPVASFTNATAQSQLLPIYESTTPSVCTMPGTTSTTVTIVAFGTCTVRARFNGNTNWNIGSNMPTKSINIVKAPQTLTFNPQNPAARNWSQGGSFTIFPLATTNAQLQPGIDIVYGVTPASTSFCSVTGTTVNILGTAGVCTLTANENGNNNYNGATEKTSVVTINPVAPGVPMIGLATAGDAEATIGFAAPTTNGGRPLNLFTATCNPGGITGTSTVPPSVTVPGLANGTPYTCSVTARNTALLTGGASGTVGVTPQATPVPPNITSTDNATFTVGLPGTFDVTANGVPAPSISVTGTLPNGITFNGPGASPRTLSGTPASGSAGTYPLVFGADGTDPDATQNFTLTIAPQGQSINFTSPGDVAFGTGPVPLVATATSGLAVAFSSSTPAVCDIAPSGTDLTLVDVGDCTVEATQPGDADWSAAPPQVQKFKVLVGSQAITFAPQVPPTRPVAPGITFAVNPTASSSVVALPITYSTATPGACSVAGTLVTMHNAGTCTIVASQPGTPQYAAAVDVNQSVALLVSSQSITFPPQPPQGFSPGGQFTVNPAATASSLLPVTYSSDTTGVCTITGDTVTMVSVGTCTLRAYQLGDSNFAVAPEVTASIAIGAVAPDAPTIGASTPGNQHAKIAFTAPANDGGSAITAYRATCNPGGLTGTNTVTPVTVNGLTNGQAYTCSVAAQNAQGFSGESATVGVVPSLQGAALWATNCQNCHGPTPGGPRFNAAGSTLSTQVLDYVIANNYQMATSPGVPELTPLERLDLKQYISSYLQPISNTTAVDTPKTISVGSHLSLNTPLPTAVPGVTNPGSFSHVVIDTPPAHGTLSVFDGVEVVYTPNPGYVGPDSFTYHGQRTSPTVVTGDTHTVSITVSPTAPVLTVSTPGTGSGLVYSDSPTSGIVCPGDCVEAYTPGTLVSLFAAVNPGSTFIGWGGACAASGTNVNCVVTMSVARDVIATFDLTPFDLTVSRTGAGAGSVSSNPSGIACGATCTVGFAPGALVTLSPVATPGSQFTGWGGACSGSGACVVTMDAAKSVSANFEPAFILTTAKAGTGTGSIDSAPAGIACGSTCSFEYLTGTMVALTATPAAGSQFTGWSGACSGTGACNVSMTAARSVTATFAPMFTLTVAKTGLGTGTVASAPAGISCGSTCAADFVDATVVTLTPTDGPDSVFDGWSGACTGMGACSVTMSAARSVTAAFKSSIALTVTRAGTGLGVVTSSPDGVGVGCGAGCTVGFAPGTVVILGQSPTSGSVFAGWNGACTGSGACVVTMDTSRSVTATFNTVTPGALADISITSQSANPPAAAVGQDITFSFALANNGPSAATGVSLVDTLPAGATFVSGSAGCVHASGTVTCSLGGLAPGASLQVDIVARFTTTGAKTNGATVIADQADPFGFNNSSTLNVAILDPARLGNVSTRMQVLTGDDVMIGGFVIGGATSKTLVVRARGPSLAAAGITNFLANPQIQLFAGQTQVGANDDFGTAANLAQLQASGFAPSNPLESAILTTLAPGAYTAIVSGVGNGVGVGIMEVFEVDHPEVPLLNLSTRGRVLTGADVMINGFVVQGDGPQTVVIRARGPSLAPLGVAAALTNPALVLVRSSDGTVIASNDDWQSAANALDIQASGFAPSDPFEAAILITLQPGAYTAIVTGTGGVTGVAIVEVFKN